MPGDDAESRNADDMVLAPFEGMADAWAAEVNLAAMIKNVASVARLNRNVPATVREDFYRRQEEQIDALIRQAFIEAAVRVFDQGAAEIARLRARPTWREGVEAAAAVAKRAKDHRFDCCARGQPDEMSLHGHRSAAYEAEEIEAAIRALKEPT